MENLGTALWITLIGMGLVFVAILVLWGLMALLVRVTRDKPQEILTSDSISKPIESNSDLKAKAAAVAVAVALASAPSMVQGKFQPPSDTVSAWQSANRNNPV
jgi:Na+-transporting methylmalonyl-CoA/oxaloacetate decarboxylase gamma subunit